MDYRKWLKTRSGTLLSCVLQRLCGNMCCGYNRGMVAMMKTLLRWFVNSVMLTILALLVVVFFMAFLLVRSVGAGGVHEARMVEYLKANHCDRVKKTPYGSKWRCKNGIRWYDRKGWPMTVIKQTSDTNPFNKGKESK